MRTVAAFTIHSSSFASLSPIRRAPRRSAPRRSDPIRRARRRRARIVDASRRAILDLDRHSAPRPRVVVPRALAPDARGARKRSARSNGRPRRRARRATRTMATRVVAMVLTTLALVAGADASAFVGTDANFERDVMNSGKHAFVKYLAPW
jgi:hypothetical protein